MTPDETRISVIEAKVRALAVGLEIHRQMHVASHGEALTPCEHDPR